MTVDRGEIIYEQDETLDKIYFICRGQVKLYIDMLNYIYDRNLALKVIEHN